MLLSCSYYATMFRQEEQVEEVSKMYHEAITTYKRLLMEAAYKAAPTAVNSQAVSDPSGGNYGNQPVASGNQYLSSYTPPSVYGQQPEVSSMNMRYSPELSRRAHHPPAAASLLQQQQQPLPQAPPTQSIQLAPPTYQVSHTVYCLGIKYEPAFSLGTITTRLQSPRNWKVSIETQRHHILCNSITYLY